MRVHIDKNMVKVQLELLEDLVQALKTKLRPKRPSKARGKRLYSPYFSPALDLPYLPTEIWMLILREATSMSPDPLDVSLSFLERPCQLSEYYESMHNKQNMALVSKFWNRLVQVYLYEFVWISRASQAKALALTLLTQFVEGKPSSGPHIRRLHMETPVLRRCATDDIHTILTYAPHLVIYSDHHAVRCTRYSEFNDVRCSPEQMVSALAGSNSKLRRLSLTNYSDDPFPHHLSPMLQQSAANLEYLELSSSSIPLVSGHLLASSSSLMVSLPVLQSLKLTLDNTTFAVIASWDMPALRNVSVVSSDFSYAGPGFAFFFRAHGHKLRQLELGHSSSLIVEHNLTLPPRPVQLIPLADWCPNLKEFICSADAEWNWRNPDWIAPHVLLPAHEHLEFIGIRDIDKRLLDDASAFPADDDDTDDAPFFPLVEQLSSLLYDQAFPSLRYIRDLSRASHSMRTGERPQARIVKFWSRVLARCGERQVWLEDFRGVNITVRDLRRVGLVM